jgi:hypothetical protein
MSLDELMEHLKAFSPADRARVEEYISSIEHQRGHATISQRHSIKGVLSGLKLDLTIEDFSAARKQISAEFEQKLARLEQQ